MKQTMLKADWHKVGHNAEAFIGASHALGYVRVVGGDVFALTNSGATQSHKDFSIQFSGGLEKAMRAGKAWVERQYNAVEVEI